MPSALFALVTLEIKSLIAILLFMPAVIAGMISTGYHAQLFSLRCGLGYFFRLGWPATSILLMSVSHIAWYNRLMPLSPQHPESSASTTSNINRSNLKVVTVFALYGYVL
jgi:hypothetical protein